MKRVHLVWMLAALLLVACGSETPSAEWALVEKFPHDPAAYTQGLIYENGILYESTGLNGESSLRKVELESGRVIAQQRLEQQFFGEGLTLFDGRLFQLTWRSGVAFVYSAETFKPIGIFRYQTEGWGLTNNGEHLIMSDGSARLYFRDADTFAIVRTVMVTENEKPVRLLNELEFVEGEIWANVYRSDDIVQIDPANGNVTRRLNLAGLLAADDRHGNEDVLNGIAYDPQTKRLFVTGKRYGMLYELAICPPKC